MSYKSGFSIKWSWHQVGEDGPDVPLEDREQLDEHATERANEMIAEGFVEGELNAEEMGPDHDRHYRGWWKKEELA